MPSINLARFRAEIYKSLLQADDLGCLGLGEGAKPASGQPCAQGGGGQARTERGLRSELRDGCRDEHVGYDRG